MMDVFNSKPRKIICIANDDRGGMCVKSENAKLLEVGNVYNMTYIEVHSWYTVLCVEEFGDIEFNSVYFSEVEG